MTLFAVCGSVGGFVSVTDNGDGTCSAFVTEGTVTTPIANCATLAYPSLGVCQSLRSNIKISIRRASSAPYVQPDIQKWLTQLGLNSIVISQGSLTVEVNHSPFPPIPSAFPPTIGPFFLPNIRQVTLTLACFRRPFSLSFASDPALQWLWTSSLGLCHEDTSFPSPHLISQQPYPPLQSHVPTWPCLPSQRTVVCQFC